MIINRNSGNTQFVRTNPTRQAKGGSFGEALNKASSAKDTFSSSAVSGTVFSQSSVSTVSGTQAKLDKISAAIKDTDYSGMTKTEFRADIEDKYSDAFDDFYATLIMSTCTDYTMIHDHFYDSLYENTGTRFTFEEINEARGYSGMSFDEVEAAIKEKYSGKTSYIDQLNFFGELWSSGILHHKFGRDMAIRMAEDMKLSNQCRGDGRIDKNEWLSRVENMGAKSPFSLLINNPYFANMKEIYKTMVDDILFGVVGVNK